MTRVVGQSAAVRASLRQHYFAPRTSSRIMAPPIVGVEVLPVAVAVMVEGVEVWHHVLGDHHNPVVLGTEVVVSVLFVVVAAIGAYRWVVEFVRRRPD